jgi:hypothetical protein
MGETGRDMRADALSASHHGHLVTFETRDGAMRTIVLGGARHWTYDGRDRVGLLDLSTAGGPWSGTEYVLDADTAVCLADRMKCGVPKARKKDYPDPISTNQDEEPTDG